MAGTITELREQKKRRDRISVYLDGHFAFGLKDTVAAQLRVGQFLSDEEIANLKEQDRFAETYQRALNFLSYRPRSEAEVRRNLRDKDVPETVISQVIEHLKMAGYVDDASFAKYWVEQRETFKPRSAQMLRHELRQKGVGSREIEQALEGLDEMESARRLAIQRVHRYEHLPRDAFWHKMVGYLQRRGFRYETIKPIVEELWQGKEHVDPDT